MKHALPPALAAALAFTAPAAATAAIPFVAMAQSGGPPVVLPLRERAALEDHLLALRLERVVPALMREAAVDTWILVAREYAEDPVVETMLPATWLAARRRTILLFHDPGPEHEVERLIVARYDVGGLFTKAWDKERQPDQWARLAELVAERDPERIAIDVSSTSALADGLTHSQHDELRAALGPWSERLVPAETLAIGWLETRIAEELELYPSLCKIAHAIIAEGLSDAVVQPGHTTTADVEWWYRERILERRLETWFHPSVSLQRASSAADGDFSSDPGPDVIRRGDLLHVDFGIRYLGLNTDTQQHAYVLRLGEAEPPAGLVRALARGNRLQDLLTAEFAVGRTGNEVLAATRAAAEAQGLVPSIYTHPLGYHGHGAGPLIGLWDQQGGVPGRGDLALRASTVWSIELNATEPIPEWGGRQVRIMLEEDAWFDGERVHYLDGRQTELIVIE